MNIDVSSAALRRELKTRFGLDGFRPGQEETIRALLSGRDVLAVLPTGAGKSLVYQLAAQLLPGVTVVVTPLLALMKDQVDSLEEAGVPVELINSQQSKSASEEAMEQVHSGEVKLLYVTPERFQDEEFLRELKRQEVSLLVVDEAHCLSEWGHSFRPAYLGLGGVAELLRKPTLLAMTATATPWVRRDIVERLGMRDPAQLVRGVDRPNLRFEVTRVEEEREEKRVLERLFRAEEEAAESAELLEGTGIIYTATTRAAQETAEWLNEWGVSADYYHGQRTKADRTRVQEAFMAGEIQVVVATNAFGMGIDKPDVRFVVHRDIPPSLEEYYQEAGRAGRDEEPARCLLIYRPGDLGRAAFMAGGGTLTREDVEKGREALLQQREGTVRELASLAGIGVADFQRLTELLTDMKVVRLRRGKVKLLTEDFDPESVSLEGEEHRRAYERSRLEMMRTYAELSDCRRQFILNYFGQEMETDRCGGCDNDLHRAPSAAVALVEDEGPFRLNDQVEHGSWGLGLVQRVTRDTLTVLFEKAGYKTLDLKMVLEEALLTTPASALVTTSGQLVAAPASES